MLPISARPRAVRCLRAVAPWSLILVAQLACGSIAPKSFGNGGTSGGGAGATGSAGSGGAAGTGGAGGAAGIAGAAGTAATTGGQGGSGAWGGGQGGGAGNGTAGSGGNGGSAGHTVGGNKGGGGMGGVAATGGAAGSAGVGGGGGAPTCASLETDYQNAVNSAKSCTTSGVCPTKISKTICGCQGCPSMTFVSDPAGPNKVATDWQKLGCTCPKVLCIACLNEPTSATCTSILTTAADPIGGGGIIQLPRTCTDH